MLFVDPSALVTGNPDRLRLPVTAGRSAPGRRPFVLLGSFFAAKAVLALGLVLDGRGALLTTPAALVVLIYQDAMFFVAYEVVDTVVARATRRLDKLAWALCLLGAFYTAVNVAIARVLSTPLTRAMVDATGGALSDSIFMYATPANLGAIAAVLFATACLALYVPVPRTEVRAISTAFLLAIGLVGRAYAARVDLGGIERNSVLTLLQTSLVHSERNVAPSTPFATTGQSRDLSGLDGAARGRDVVWVILESTAARYLGVYGAKPDPTPNLSRFAENALVFDAAYSAYPESIKGLLSMLCSLHPAPHTTAKDYVVSKEPCSSIATTLRGAGYRTAFFHSGRFRYLGMQGILDGRGFDELYDAENVGGSARTSFGTDDASTAARLLRYVDELPDGARFFAVYSPISGHHPYRAPGRRPSTRPEHSDQDAYFNDLYSGDRAFGELVEGFRARGRLPRTVFVVVGDHGEAFGQHVGNFAHTLFLYDENVRVPFIIAAPGLVHGTIRAPQVTSLVDMSPTTLALLGMAPGIRSEGRSALDAVPGVALFMADQGPLKLGLRGGDLKCIHETEHDRTRLFDLKADPDERVDLAGNFPARAAECRTYLRRWAGSERPR